jgi:hypothetical protein
VHPLYEKADKLSSQVIGAAIEVHRDKGPGLIESITSDAFCANWSCVRFQQQHKNWFA